MDEIEQACRVVTGQGRQTMLPPLEAQKMLRLSAQGWGTKRIRREPGCSRNTVRQYLRQGGGDPEAVGANPVLPLFPHQKRKRHPKVA